jgi:GTP-binding protein
MMDYFENRKQLKMVFQLIDARIPPQKIDIEFAMALTQLNIPYVVIFTKADRKLKNEIAKNMLAYKNELKEFAKNEPQTFITSVSDRTGHIELLKWMGKLI